MAFHRRRARSGALPVLAALLAALSGSDLAAQQEPALPDLGSLKPASAPAFILLDVSPTAVERPSEAADLAFSLANRSSMLSRVPENYALEFSPYWLRPRPALTWQADSSRSLGAALARTLSLSAATAELGTGDAPLTGVALGGRAQLVSGRHSTETRRALRALEDSLAAEGGLLLRMANPDLQSLEAWLREQLAQPDAAPAQIRQEYLARRTAIYDRVMASADYQARVARMRSAFDNLALRREGPMLEVAGGASWGFPGGTWDRGSLRRWGAWASYGCERCVQWQGGTPFTPVAVLRYLGGEQGDSLGNALDFGGRLILGSARYSASVEGVRRQFVGDGAPDARYRLAGIMEYQVGQDLWLRASFGRDYQTEREGSLLAQFGLKFNFADQRYAPGARDGS
jgi:hypothetical protein